MRRIAVPTLLVMLALTLVLAPAAPLRAQSLREQISELFIFGPGHDPLFLGGSGDPRNPVTIQAHGTHFVPAASAANATVIAFIIGSISANVSNVPLSATSGGTTFRFDGGVPVKTSESPGPIFGERAQTLGRGRMLVGANLSSLHFTTLRGTDLRNILLTFTHANVDFDGCDAAFGGDCTLMGIPELENDIMQFRLSLDLSLRVTSFFLTYGLADRVDLGVVLPVVVASFHGESEGQIVPFGGPTVAHFFGGTPENPELSASRFVQADASGIGDVALRLKVNMHRTDRASFSLLGDARFPTGSEDDLLGSGAFAMRGLGILSARFGDFSPHLNGGYLYRNSDEQNDAVLATVGFDNVLAPWATLAADLVSEFQVGRSKLRLPGVVAIETPFLRTAQPTTIPDTRDDIVSGSLGFKLTAAPGLLVIANAIWPLNRGGLRANAVWTAGLEYNF
jgi:hypothetical protein